MDDIRDALLRMYRVAKKSMNLEKSLEEIGYGGGLVNDIYAEAADAIYCLIGERTETFKQSVTYVVLHTVSLDEDRAVCLLLGAYKRNHPEQPNPQFIDPEKMQENVKKVGGYQYQTPEGDWS